MVLLIVGLILFICLILVHEWGHFIVAKRNGVEVEEYGVFFPPRLWSRKTKGGWDFSINALPIGGFVRLKGESDSDTRKGTFGAAPLWVKIKIMFAGIGMNLLVAFGLLTFLALAGMPQLVDNQFTVGSNERLARHEVLVGYVEPGSPAEKAGIQVRDQLLSIRTGTGEVLSIAKATDLPLITQKQGGKVVVVSYERAGEVQQKTITLRNKDQLSDTKGALGVAPTEYSMKRYTWSAPVVAVGTMAQFTGLTFQGLGTAISSLFQGDAAKASEQVSGPVGIFAVMQKGTFLGYQFILLIVAVISLSLAIMNLLPIPALDGGKIFVTLTARLFGKRVSKRAEAWLYGGSFVLLLLLLLLITVVDVRRFF
ncbi:MAG: M50 family metallopeptidase [Candidatus Saccharimonadales bacterium]